MRPWVSHAITLVGILAGCTISERPERQLAWVRSADADQMFREDVGRDRIRFLVVCGIGCSTPELGTITYQRCYRQHAGKRVIDETYDVIVSKEHGQLKQLAANLAANYNRRALAFLDSTGSRTCPAREHWDELWDAMAQIGDSVPKHPYSTSVLAYWDRRGGIDFHLHVPNPVDLKNSLKTRLCALVPRFGIDSIRVRVTTGNINDHPREERPFACYGSRVVA